MSIGQTVTVRDVQTMEPLEMTTLSQHENAVSVWTNARGQADLAEFHGLEGIDIQRLGYKTINLNFSDVEI